MSSRKLERIATLLAFQAGGIASSEIAGTTTNNNAASGLLGEIVSSLVAVGSPQAMTTNTAMNVTSISLTAGDWDVEANVNFINTGSTLTGSPNVQAGINTTSATIPVDGSEVSTGLLGVTLTNTDGVTIPRKRVSIAVTTTVYLCAKAIFTIGTFTSYGQISGRRVR